jgi:hypothetical protein
MTQRRRQLERRAAERYPIHLDLDYRVSYRRRRIVEGSAKTRDISSAGVSFSPGRPCPPGATAELWIDWPGECGEGSARKLVVSGPVVRSGRRGSAVLIVHSRFVAAAADTAAAVVPAGRVFDSESEPKPSHGTPAIFGVPRVAVAAAGGA